MTEASNRTIEDQSQRERAGESANFAVIGGPGARLLAGPTRSEGTERITAHQDRLGTLNLEATEPTVLLDSISSSGLLGRGGGQFPIARKLALAAESSGQAIIVVNGSEGEPASRKDRTLLELRPHLVLDGAMVAAHAARASDVVIYLHRSRRDATAAIEAAIAERPRTSVGFRVVDAPSRYVAGESSAVVSFLDGAGALPQRRRDPAAIAGVAGRPTVINNVETVAHLGLIARFGSDWFRGVGGSDSPGSSLVTLAGEVTVPGVVAELIGDVSVSHLLGTIGGQDVVPRAVLVGGYEGTWLDGDAAWEAVLSRDALAQSRISLGCGVIAVLGPQSCGLATTARLVRWLAGESAGQCGSCAFGLPAIAELLEAIVTGVGSRRDLRRLEQLCVAVDGRGACGHPSGVVALVESALATFESELRDHLRGRACEPVLRGFPLPTQADRSNP